MPRILSRYIFLESLHYFGISLFAFTALLLTLRMLKFASLIINKGVEFSQIAAVFVAIIPTFLEIAIPLSALLGIMLAFARLSGDSEIVVMRASGVSLKQLLAPVFLFGILTALLALLVSSWLKPLGYDLLSRSLFEIARSRSTAGLTAGVFNELGELTIYADTINFHTEELENVLIEDRRDEDTPKIINAHDGIIKSNNQDQTITFYLRDGEIHELAGQKYVTTQFSRNNITLKASELYDNSSERSRKKARELRMQTLREEIKTFEAISAGTQSFIPVDEREREYSPEKVQEKVRKRLVDLKVEIARRFSMPFAAFILALIAMPLGIQSPRTQKAWGASLSASLAMLTFVFYYGLLTVGITMSEGYILNPYISVWIPNIGCIAIAAYTLKMMSRERWQSIGQAFETAALYLSGVFSRSAK